MSEYWKSTPKYWCKHCSLYVKDTPLERKQHENTAKHQGNLKRFLRGIQNDHEKTERDKERAKAEVERLNKVVGGQQPTTSASASKPDTNRKPSTAAPTVGDQKRQWAQLAEMGIQVPDAFRAEMAIPGQWQSVARPTEELSASELALNTGIRKRKVEDEEEDEGEGGSAQTKRRGWGATTRRYPGEVNADLDTLLSEPLFSKKIVAKSQPIAAIGSLTPSKVEGDVPVKSADDNQEQLVKVETAATADPIPESLINASTTGTMEESGLDRQDMLAASSPDISAPVFKKRKPKVKP